jgi:hypothetical protein
MTNHRSLVLATLLAVLWTTGGALNPAAAQIALAVEGNDDVSRLEAALSRSVSLEFVDTPLRDVIQFVANRTGAHIKLSKKIEDAGVQPDQPVTMVAKDVAAEKFLSLLLRELNLTFILKHGVILVTTNEEAQSPENMLTRVYPVADLCDWVRLPREYGGGLSLDFDPLVDMITSTIEPDSWQDVGGPGSITGFENSRSLVIATRYDLHQKIAPLLVTLRRAKGLQGIRTAAPQSGSAQVLSTPLKLSSPLPVRNRDRPGSIRVQPIPKSSQAAPGGGGLF